MENILTVESFFNKLENKKQQDTLKEEYTEKEKITISGNPYYAEKGNREGHWRVWKGSGGEPIASITKLEDGNFLLRTISFPGNKRDSMFQEYKNIKIPNIERGLKYMKDEEEERRKKFRDKIDLDLT